MRQIPTTYERVLERVWGAIWPCLLAAVVLAAGCGGARTFDESVTVEPAVVTGAVGGLVLDFLGGAGVEGLTVSVVTGEAVVTGVTDSAGAFSVPEVPAGGAIIVQVDGGGAYSSVVWSTVIPVAAGQQPLANPEMAIGPFGVLPRSLSVALQLVTIDGFALNQADVTVSTAVEFFDLSDGEVAYGAHVATAMTDATGIVTFDSLPDVANMSTMAASDDLFFQVDPVDLDGDGTFDVESITFTRSARDLAAGLLVVDVDFENDNLTVVSSNVYSLLGLGNSNVPSVVDGAVQIVFNQPLDDQTIAVTVSDEEGIAVADVAVAVPAAPFNRVTVNAPAAGWPTGVELNIEVHAMSADNFPPRSYDAGAAFFTSSTAPVTVTAARDTSNPDLIRLVFSEPIGLDPGSDFTLSGGNCPVYIMFDLNMNGNLNDPNETAGPSCSIAVNGDEPNPFGLPGLSGYTTQASFTTPGSIPGAFTFDLRFSRIGNASNRPTTSSGMLVPDLTATVN